jgi:PadR family transcriptional regulator, regulatory protein AphA
VSCNTCTLFSVSLRYAILGYLSTAPGSGYDLAQQLDGGLGWFWSAAHSQIYPELKRLQEADLITSSAETVGDKLEKRVYSITDAGLGELTSWAAGEPLYRPNRDPERLQLIFSDLGSVESVRRHLEAHRDHFAERHERLAFTKEQMASRLHARVEQRLVGREPSQQAFTMLLRDLAYGGEVERAKTEVAWAEDALERLDRYEREMRPEA